MTNLEDSLVEYGAWATGVGAQYYMFYIEMQSGTLLLYKTTGEAGLYIEITSLENAGEAAKEAILAEIARIEAELEKAEADEMMDYLYNRFINEDDLHHWSND